MQPLLIGSPCLQASCACSHPSACLSSSGYSPLYFQHNGHSRTIVGVERFKVPGTLRSVYNLLVLDPSVSSQDIEAKLKNGKGWQVQAKAFDCFVLCMHGLFAKAMAIDCSCHA